MRRAAPEERMRGGGVAEARKAQQDHALDMRTVQRRVLQRDQPSEGVPDDRQGMTGEFHLLYEAAHAVTEQRQGVLEVRFGRQPEPEQIGNDQAVVALEGPDLPLPVAPRARDAVKEQQDGPAGISGRDVVQGVRRSHVTQGAGAFDRAGRRS